MIKNYFKIAWRTILKNRATFTINIVGLSLGITSCLLITLFVVDELSYDRFNENSDRMARVLLNAKMGDEIIKESTVMAPVARTFVEELPEVVDATRIVRAAERTKVTYNGNTLRKGKMAMADANLFQMFSLALIKGDPNTVLDRPRSVVLTQEQAKAYFGEEEPLDKTIQIHDIGIFAPSGYVDNSGFYTVTGIMEQIPDNSHFHFDLIASMASNADADNQSWLSGSYHTYLLFAEGADLGGMEAKLSGITKKYMGPQLKKGLGMDYGEFLEAGNHVGFFMQPLTDIHLHSELSGQLEQGGQAGTVYMFAAIALFMLLIACFNFMNLSTAGASKRLKEIGIRKVLGSDRKRLVTQFLTESFMATFLAMGIGLLLFLLALPYFNQLSGKSLTYDLLLNPRVMVALVGLTALVSLMAGGYPAFFMSSFKPIQALKNKFSFVGGKGVRSGLVVFQFAISISLIIGTLVVGRQMDFIQNKDLGYDREELIVVRDAGLLGNDFGPFREELRKDPRILNMTTSAFVPAGPTDTNGATLYSKRDPTQQLRTKVFNIDEEYLPTLGIKLLKGRNFSKDFGSEQNNIIINETAVKTFGLDGNPVGQTLVESTDLEGGRATLTIVGVVKDFHSRSLHEPIQPLLMKYNPYYGLIVKAKAGDIADLIALMENRWKSFGSKEVFGYALLDELYNETYLRERNMNSILQYFSFLTIFVACLGLFGLVTFTAQQRFKEIGIRKVLGSSVPQIVVMLAKDFLKLVLISMLIAFPFGYYAMDKWLQGFAYSIDIDWWIFAVAGVVTVLIAFLTISFRSIKAALANPVQSLRME